MYRKHHECIVLAKPQSNTTDEIDHSDMNLCLLGNDKLLRGISYAVFNLMATEWGLGRGSFHTQTLGVKNLECLKISHMTALNTQNGGHFFKVLKISRKPVLNTYTMLHLLTRRDDSYVILHLRPQGLFHV